MQGTGAPDDRGEAAAAPGRTGGSARGRSGGPAARIALVAVALVAVLGAVVVLLPAEAAARLPWADAPPCPREAVEVLVEPELQGLVGDVLLPLEGTPLPGERCLSFEVRAQEGAETVASAQVLPPDRAPQIWIPDSMTWPDQVTKWRTQRVAAFASSPVVVATSTTAANALGWTRRAPDWNSALRGKRPMAVPDIDSEAESLAALIALWQSLGKGPSADQAIVKVVLAADRGEIPSADAAFAVARSGTANAPVVPATEQAVAAANREAGETRMTAVYPKQGSPNLDYPVLRVSTTALSPARAAATRLVVGRLNSSAALEAARAAGFRGPDGSAPQGAGISTAPVRTLRPPDIAEVEGMVTRVQNLARPSRILAVVDVSQSMRQKLDDGITRIALAEGSVRLGMQMLPDSTTVGAWVFADDLKDGRNWQPISAMQPLGSRDDIGETHRSLLNRTSGDLSDYISGGSSLYDAVRAASRSMHDKYDPKAVNAIILLSDGRDESSSVSLDGLLEELRASNAGRKKVAIYTGGLGADADLPVLRQIAQATGGYHYRIDTALEGHVALLDGLRRSRQLGR